MARRIARHLVVLLRLAFQLIGFPKVRLGTRSCGLDDSAQPCCPSCTRLKSFARRSHFAPQGPGQPTGRVAKLPMSNALRTEVTDEAAGSLMPHQAEGG
jgi:hypothetical protein